MQKQEEVSILISTFFFDFLLYFFPHATWHISVILYCIINGILIIIIIAYFLKLVFFLKSGATSFNILS